MLRKLMRKMTPTTPVKRGHDPSPIYYIYVLYIMLGDQEYWYYGGKGSGDRIYQHERIYRGKLKSGRKLDCKERLMLFYEDAGYTLRSRILMSDMTEDEAFNMENEVIRGAGLLQRGNVAYPRKLRGVR